MERGVEAELDVLKREIAYDVYSAMLSIEDIVQKSHLEKRECAYSDGCIVPPVDPEDPEDPEDPDGPKPRVEIPSCPDGEDCSPDDPDTSPPGEEDEPCDESDLIILENLVITITEKRVKLDALFEELNRLKSELYQIEDSCPDTVELILQEETVYLTTEDLLGDLKY